MKKTGIWLGMIGVSSLFVIGKNVINIQENFFEKEDIIAFESVNFLTNNSSTSQIIFVNEEEDLLEEALITEEEPVVAEEVEVIQEAESEDFVGDAVASESEEVIEPEIGSDELFDEEAEDGGVNEIMEESEELVLESPQTGTSFVIVVFGIMVLSTVVMIGYFKKLSSVK